MLIEAAAWYIVCIASDFSLVRSVVVTIKTRGQDSTTYLMSRTVTADKTLERREIDLTCRFPINKNAVL